MKTTATREVKEQQALAEKTLVQLEILEVAEKAPEVLKTGDNEKEEDSSKTDGDDHDHDQSSLPSLDEVEEILRYDFKNKSLLEEAFTDSSYPDKPFSYDRLAYFGDAVLNMIFTKEQFHEYPNLDPGDLTRLRSSNVDTEKLARVAFKHGLHRYLRHKKPLLDEKIRRFSEGIMEYPLYSCGLVESPKVLAEIIESTAGAVFVDSGHSMDTVWKVLKPLMEPIISKETMQVHPVTELQEICQKNKLQLKFIDIWKESKTVYVFVEGELAGVGRYDRKKEIAKKRAARDALNNIAKFLVVHEDNAADDDHQNNHIDREDDDDIH